MSYQYRYRMRAFDFWQLSMYYIYGSIAGVCNIIFTAALLLLAYSKWNELVGLWHFFMLFGGLFFPVIQPLLVYQKAKRQAAAITQDTELSFHQDGIHVKVGEQSSHIEWSSVKGILKKPTMLILLSDGRHGFVLTNRVLGKEKKEFCRYINSKIMKK